MLPVDMFILLLLLGADNPTRVTAPLTLIPLASSWKVMVCMSSRC